MSFTFEKRVVKDGITVVNKELIDHLQDGILEALNLSAEGRAVEAVVESGEEVVPDGDETVTEVVEQEQKTVAPEQLLSDALKHHCCGGKVVSVLGDDFSALDGVVPFEYETYYPSESVLYISQMWWGIVLASLGAKLGVNESAMGSKVADMADVNRIKNLRANGTPDIIFVFGGANDCGTLPTGSFDETQEYSVDLTKTSWETTVDAYKEMIMRIQHFHPTARIVAMLPTFSTKYTAQKLNEVNRELVKICDYFGVDTVDLRKCGITAKNVEMYSDDGMHVNIDGMNAIARYTLKNFKHILDCGENVVYRVRNELMGVMNTASSVVGVSEGETYTNTLIGVSDYSGIKVYMGDADITATALDTLVGRITIKSVSDHITITQETQGMGRAL